MSKQRDVVVIGAGAAGLFCAAQAGQLGLDVLVLDNGKKPGRKILMSGGGRCNFTNMYIEPSSYLSKNKHFCKSALARYTQWDFIDLVCRHDIAYHEKTLGQLFCDDSAEQIVTLLLSECEKGAVELQMRSEVQNINQADDGFTINLMNGDAIQAKAIVVATGGLSMPGLGATPFGYRVAEQFGHTILPTRAGLVPFTLHKPLLDRLQALSGIALPVTVSTEDGTAFKESLLFTHRGLSGPAILQLSNYWLSGQKVTIDLLPTQSVDAFLQQERIDHPNVSLKNALAKLLPKRLIEVFQLMGYVPEANVKQLTSPQIEQISAILHQWEIQPNGTEGYRTAEVTLGGVNTDEISSKSMESKKAAGLYFIGEVVDVTGWLGGYNFQWAWSSAWACAQALAEQMKSNQDGAA